MHRVHGLLPGATSESLVPRPQAGRPGRRTAAAQGPVFLQLCAQVLPQLQALRSGLPLRRKGGGPYPERPHQVRYASAQTAGPNAGFHGLHGQAGTTVCPHRQCRYGSGCHQKDAGYGFGYRPPENLPQIQRTQFRGLAQTAQQGAGGVPGAGGLFPRMLRELQLPAAWQGPGEGAQRPGRGRSITGR